MSDSPAEVDPKAAPALREVRYEASGSLIELLSGLGATLLVTTYQAGKLVVVGTYQNNFTLSFHNFDRPMGLAIGERAIAVGGRQQIWMLDDAPDIARRLEPAGKYQACFLTRS